MAAEMSSESDGRILALFESPSEIDTPTPGVKAWLAGDVAFDATPRAVLLKRVREGSGFGSRKARATESLHLNHDNILRPRRWIADGEFIYIAREVVRGKNLRQALTTASGERPGPELLRKLLLPLMDGLAFSHGQGVIHGGVSPENILIAEDGRLLLVDFATTDPNAPRHQPNYAGKATIGGDVRALGSVLAAYLPTGGAFQNIAVRGRIEGLIRRCDSLEDLREILNSLERLATTTAVPGAPGGMSRPKDGVPQVATEDKTQLIAAIGMPRLAMPGPETAEPVLPVEDAAPALPITVTVVEKTVHVPQGGGGIVTLNVRNEGPTPLLIRMIATQHAWINVRPIGLPLTIPVSASERIEFAISAARLTPGEYRGEIYLSAHPAGAFDEAANTGWDKHTSEIRVTVDSSTPPISLNSQATAPGPGMNGRPPYPSGAPSVRGMGCAVLPLLLLALPIILLPLVQLFLH